jgi:hypothetical protein
VGLARQRNCAQHGDAFRFAAFATLGFVLELLVVEEELLSGGENKITSTIDTLEHLVLKFH